MLKGRTMPKFLTIAYGNKAGYDRTPQAIRRTADEQDARLVEEGAVMGIAGVQCRYAQTIALPPMTRAFVRKPAAFWSAALIVAT
jgi:hypothetical protein